MEQAASHHKKVYVEVNVNFGPDGLMKPRTLVWEDGRSYEIDRILDVRSAPALKAGGQGDRYRVRVCGQEKEIYFEHNADISSRIVGRWFVEAKV